MSEEVQDQGVTKLLAQLAVASVGKGDVTAPAAPLNNQEEENKESSEFLRLKEEGNGLYQNNQFEDALAKYDEAFAHANDEKQVAALLHNKGATYEKMNNMDKALEMYGEAISKRPGYVRGHQRRCRLLSTMGRYLEAMKDIVEITVFEIKTIGATPEDPTEYLPLDVITAKMLMELISLYTQTELQNFVVKRNSASPSKHAVECFLRLYFADPVSRIWRGIDKSIVDDLIADGKADHLIGYKAALRDLKLKKYDNIYQYCSDEIENPESAETQLYAYFLRGTMGVMWYLTEQCLLDLEKVIDSPLPSDQLKSSAALKVAFHYSCCNRMTGNLETLSLKYEVAENLWPQNPDVYYHGTMALVHRGLLDEGLQMLELGVEICGNNCSILMRTLYWTLKFITSNKDFDDQMGAMFELKLLEPLFDTEECYSLFVEVLMMCGESNSDEIMKLIDKAIALNPDDPLFKIDKIVRSHHCTETGTASVEAIELLHKLMETEGPFDMAYSHIAQIELMRENVKEGLEAIEKSIELSRNVLEAEGRIMQKMETIFHADVNDRLEEEGLEELSNEITRLSFR